MRLSISVALAVLATLAASCFVWTRGALADLPDASVCLRQRDRDRLTAGKFAMAEQDIAVAKAMNGAMGRAANLSWHARGKILLTSYRTFWTSDERAAEFRRLVSRA